MKSQHFYSMCPKTNEGWPRHAEGWCLPGASQILLKRLFTAPMIYWRRALTILCQSPRHSRNPGSCSRVRRELWPGISRRCFSTQGLWMSIQVLLMKNITSCPTCRHPNQRDDVDLFGNTFHWFICANCDDVWVESQYGELIESNPYLEYVSELIPHWWAKWNLKRGARPT